ncbi:uncharacterized protein ASCRUDRAFT_75264 [Ascoidea rubescens DSM 1968]|uniref:Uncharacterized protein n=1 Tax=Ascoidea rubescens DSM 1968 TaxID=1344418 RepID=A0A1D2VKA0_9ASCO|nr:hypothetical protein ASCRUDRAFT_75264 [Ascoidea rubescens DSM 1968]ODV62042.1 hypothetical protein ASCRUDRAFT_75264 [Ascoidea rubescens DSM 1968]
MRERYSNRLAKRVEAVVYENDRALERDNLGVALAKCGMWDVEGRKEQQQLTRFQDLCNQTGWWNCLERIQPEE